MRQKRADIRNVVRLRGNTALVNWLCLAVVLVLLAGTLSACGTDEAATDAPDVEVEVSPALEAEMEERPSPEADMEASPSPEADMEQSPSPEADASPATPAADGVTLDDITANPDAYFGETVTVAGAVNVVLSERAFTVADNTLLDLNEVMVIGAEEQALDAALEQDAQVQVTGTVGQLVVAEIEQEYGIDLDPEIEAEFEDRPVIVAEAVEVGVENVTLDAITENPDVYVGETVMVNGGIDEVLAQQAFTMADSTFLDTNEVLVVGAAEEMLDTALAAGSPVWVRGTVRTFDIAEVEEEVAYDLDDEVFEEYAGQPAIVAESILVTEATTATIADIMADPLPYYGRFVSVYGVVNKVVDERAFTVVEMLGDPDEMLIVAVNEAVIDMELAQGQAVDILGVVQAVDPVAVDPVYGYAPELLADFENEAALVATSVQPAADGEASPSSEADTSLPPATQVTLEEITGNLAQYDGQMVTVEGEVDEVISPSAFSIVEEAGSEESVTSGLLIVMRDEGVSITEGERVRVTGKADEFDTTSVQTELGYHLDETHMFEPWIGQPVVVGHKLEPIQ